jgi:hypothetical protein
MVWYEHEHPDEAMSDFDDDQDWSDTESVDATEPRAVALDEEFERVTFLCDTPDPTERPEDEQ